MTSTSLETSSTPASAAAPPPPAVPAALLALLAGGAGLSAANLYVNQPLLGALATDFGAAPSAVGWLPTLTQSGYAAGLFLFAPLGDRVDVKKLLLAKGTLLAAALVASAVAPSLATLAATSFAVGLLATTAQDFVPAAAALAPEHARGKTVGVAMTGLLLGILLSRVVSGAVGERFGWRAVYVGASAAMLALVGLVALRFPPMPRAQTASYGALLRATVGLVRRYPELRRAALGQGLLAVGFSGFWSTLALVLAAEPFRLGSTAAGAFGLAGAAGALAAPVAGGLADRKGPAAVLRLGAALVVASFLAMALAPGSLVVLIAGTVTFDLGVQASLVAHQSIVYGLDPAARSRLNAVLVSSMFVGMAVGSAVASALVGRYGLAGVGALGAAAAAGALALRAFAPPAR